MLDTHAIEAYTENDNLLAWAPNGEDKWILESTLRKGAGYCVKSLERLIELNDKLFDGQVEVVTGEPLRVLKLDDTLHIDKHTRNARFVSQKAAIFILVTLGTSRAAKAFKLWAMNVINEVMSKGYYIDPNLPVKDLHGLLITQSKQIQQVLNGLQQQQDRNNYVTSQLVETGQKSLNRFGQDFSQSLSECRTLTSQNAEKTLKLQRQDREIEGHTEEKRQLRVEFLNEINPLKLRVRKLESANGVLEDKYDRAVKHPELVRPLVH